MSNENIKNEALIGESELTVKLAARKWGCVECAAVGVYGEYLRHQHLTCHGELREVVDTSSTEARDAFWERYKAPNVKVRGCAHHETLTKE